MKQTGGVKKGKMVEVVKEVNLYIEDMALDPKLKESYLPTSGPGSQPETADIYNKLLSAKMKYRNEMEDKERKADLAEKVESFKKSVKVSEVTQDLMAINYFDK